VAVAILTFHCIYKPGSTPSSLVIYVAVAILTFHCIYKPGSTPSSPVIYVAVAILTFHCIYGVSQEESARLRESVPYVKLYRYNPKHLCPKYKGYGDNGQRKVWVS